MMKIDAGKHYDGQNGEMFLRTARKDRICGGNGSWKQEYFRKSPHCTKTIRKGEFYVEYILKRNPGRMPDSVKQCIACAAEFVHVDEGAAKEGRLIVFERRRR